MEAMELDIAEVPLDHCKRQFNWNKKYIVDLDSMKPDRRGKPEKDGDFQVYTDGSKEGKHEGQHGRNK